MTDRTATDRSTVVPRRHHTAAALEQENAVLRGALVVAEGLVSLPPGTPAWCTIRDRVVRLLAALGMTKAETAPAPRPQAPQRDGPPESALRRRRALCCVCGAVADATVLRMHGSGVLVDTSVSLSNANAYPYCAAHVPVVAPESGGDAPVSPPPGTAHV